jgi:isopenicillin-N epimerase
VFSREVRFFAYRDYNYRRCPVHTVKKACKGKYGNRSTCADSPLTRRNFLKLFGAAVGGGTLLGATPVLGNGKAGSRLGKLASPSSSGEAYWRLVREQFCLKDEIIHMNTGTLSSCSDYVNKKLDGYFQTLAEDPYPTAFYEPFNLVEAHQKAAAFLGTEEDEIIVTGCTTEGMCFVANGLDLQEGDEVLTTMHDHPGGVDCWKILRDRRGITLTMLPFQGAFDSKEDIVSLFENAITSHTKVMSFCHINYTSGLKMPVKELCQLARDNNIISVVDGAHAIGMFDLDLHDLDCDFFACSPQKWLCAPPGVGVLYAKSDKQDLIWPTITESYGGKTLQSRLETRGQRSSPVLVCLGDAIDFQNAIGKDKIEKRILALSAYAKIKLAAIPGVTLHSSTDSELSSGLTFFYIKDKNKSHANLNYKIREDYNIFMRTIYFKDSETETKNQTGLRISTHIYNNYDQIDLLVKGIEENLDMM